MDSRALDRQARTQNQSVESMIPSDVLLLFVAASAALAVSPGPDNIFVLTQSAMHGRKAGLLVTLGLCSGLLAHIAAVALGVAALLQTSAIAFTALKIVGAAYLLYLAWQAFRAGATQSLSAAEASLSARSLYVRGIVMNVTNPKVAVFFLAFLPQFVDPARGAPSIQIITLGVVFMLTALVIFSGIAWGASRIGTWLRQSTRAQIAINRLAGTVFVLLACRLALSRQA
ncbi:LysE family translocator [Uliginosibacterium sp. H1]|uniref:LysE family translocator n=1 Tax=Uliginosibacterium sp. H1 TaxID=3114757 RepID=UPI002E198B04|nr:LysE family translocator [Uliginosibacterium sp. H1]